MARPRHPGPKRAAPARGKRSWRPTWVYLVIGLGILSAGVSLLAFAPPPDASRTASGASVPTSDATTANQVARTASAADPASVAPSFAAPAIVPRPLPAGTGAAAAPDPDVSRVR